MQVIEQQNREDPSKVDVDVNIFEGNKLIEQIKQEKIAPEDAMKTIRKGHDRLQELMKKLESTIDPKELPKMEKEMKAIDMELGTGVAEELQLEAAKYQRKVPNKVGRNEPCTCGSGKKYKKCCLGRIKGEEI